MVEVPVQREDFWGRVQLGGWEGVALNSEEDGHMKLKTS